MTKCILGSLMIVFLLTAASNSFGQAPEASASQSSAAQSRIVGEVTAVDKTANQVTIKTDTGESITIVTNEASSVLRLPAGETSAQKATKDYAGGYRRGRSAVRARRRRRRRKICCG